MDMRCVDALHDASFISFPVAMMYLNLQMPCPSRGGICVGISVNLFLQKNIVFYSNAITLNKLRLISVSQIINWLFFSLKTAMRM